MQSKSATAQRLDGLREMMVVLGNNQRSTVFQDDTTVSVMDRFDAKTLGSGRATRAKYRRIAKTVRALQREASGFRG
jgi:hypothetical protein